MKTRQVSPRTKWILFLGGTLLLALIVFVISFGEIPFVSKVAPAPNDALPAQSALSPSPSPTANINLVNLDDGFKPQLKASFNWKVVPTQQIKLGNQALFWTSSDTGKSGEIDLNGREWVATKLNGNDAQTESEFLSPPDLGRYFWYDSVAIGSFNVYKGIGDSVKGTGGTHGYVRTDGDRIQALIFQTYTPTLTLPDVMEYRVFLSDPTPIDFKQ